MLLRHRMLCILLRRSSKIVSTRNWRRGLLPVALCGLRCTALLDGVPRPRGGLLGLLHRGLQGFAGLLLPSAVVRGNITDVKPRFHRYLQVDVNACECIGKDSNATALNVSGGYSHFYLLYDEVIL